MDLLKCFAIFSVLVGHSTEQLSGGLFWDHPVWEFIYSYHMPLFMFVCGFFFRSSLKRGYGEMARRKFLQLGVPSLTAYAIACLIMLIAGVRAIADLCELSFNGFMNCVWFLKCLLFCYLLMYPLCRWLKKDWLAAIAATVLVILIPGTETVNFNFMLPVFCLGMICGNRQEEIENHRGIWLAASLILFGVLLCFWSGHLTVYERPTRFWAAASAAAVGGTGSAGTLTPDWNNLGLTIYRLALGMSGSMVCYLLSKPVYEAIRGWRWTETLCNIGGATLGIYFLQTFLLEILVNRLQVYVPIPHSYWVAPLLAIAELVICYNLVLLLRKTRLLRLLVLGEKQ
jgi:fucose 4-O-acetylase-like acetyltransferase